jgi:hypothetical protein
VRQTVGEPLGAEPRMLAAYLLGERRGGSDAGVRGRFVLSRLEESREAVSEVAVQSGTPLNRWHSMSGFGSRATGQASAVE